MLVQNLPRTNRPGLLFITPNSTFLAGFQKLRKWSKGRPSGRPLVCRQTQFNQYCVRSGILVDNGKLSSLAVLGAGHLEFGDDRGSVATI